MSERGRKHKRRRGGPRRRDGQEESGPGTSKDGRTRQPEPSTFDENQYSTNEEVVNAKPPPGLTGRALGLWYRDKNKVKKKLRLDNKPKVKSIPVDLPIRKQEQIRSILNQISMATPPSVNEIRTGQALRYMNIHDKYSHIEESEFKRRFLKSVTGDIESNMDNALKAYLSYTNDEVLDKKYQQEFQQKFDNREYKKMLEFRKKLPAFGMRLDIINLIDNNQVVVISGETGCGKTTQVAQFILDAEMLAGRGSTCSIMCTQPRRISAISVSERVAQERGERLGQSVGYQIRLEKIIPRRTGSILFCTTGILLQTLSGDPCLRDVSHVILDEIHERDTISDFVITILRDVIKKRKDLKIILMSATLNADQFSKYFNGCPMLNIPGFTYSVKEYYLEDVLTRLNKNYWNNNGRGGPAAGYRHARKRKAKKFAKELQKRQEFEDQFLMPYCRNMKSKYPGWVLDLICDEDSEIINHDLIHDLLVEICSRDPEGAILVFLPGWDKISALNTTLRTSGKFPESRYLIIPLHSMMPTISQKSVFDRPPRGVRKIIIATNIAETSITIDDVVVVVDCGKIKIKNFDVENNISTLKEEWVSLANARQRRGRAGRVQEGICYHLYSRPREMALSDFQLPEMVRTRLEEVILQAKVLQLGKIAPFLQKVMDPPDPRAVQLSLELLTCMNALDDEEKLTPMGYHLAHLPIDPQAGKMILLAALFGCVDPVTSIAAALSFKDPFVTPMGKEFLVDKMKLELANGCKSDHIVLKEAIHGWRQAENEGRGYQFSSRYFLSHHIIRMLLDMKKQFMNHLYEMKFVDSRDVRDQISNCHSDNMAILKAVICAGLYPNICVVKKVKPLKLGKRSVVVLQTAEDGRVTLHPKSVNNHVTGPFESPFLAYYEKIKSSEIFLHDTTMIFPMPLIFFCHNLSLGEVGGKKCIKVNELIQFTCDKDTAAIILELKAWLDWLLEYKVAHPGIINWNQRTDETFILEAILELLCAEYHTYLPEESDSIDSEDDTPEGNSGYNECYD